jgi:hypothetical protein
MVSLSKQTKSLTMSEFGLNSTIQRPKNCRSVG